MSESLLRLPEVLRRSGHSESSLYRAIAAGAFPRQHKRGTVSLWIESEVDAAIAAEIERFRNMGQDMGGTKKAA